ENRAVLARGEIEPRHFLVVDAKRGRLLLIEGGKPLPFAPGLFQPHPPADDLRNWKPRAQFVEELRGKAHGQGRVIRCPSVQARAARQRRGGRLARLSTRSAGRSSNDTPITGHLPRFCLWAVPANRGGSHLSLARWRDAILNILSRGNPGS